MPPQLGHSVDGSWWDDKPYFKSPVSIGVVSHKRLCYFIVLLQHGAEPAIRNTDGRTALDLADPSAKAVLTGKWCLFKFVTDRLWLPVLLFQK